MMSDVFSKVADEMGVKRTFSELVPEEPWAKHIELMAVPEQLLFLELLGNNFTESLLSVTTQIKSLPHFIDF